MQTILKICLVVAALAFLKKQLLDGPRDFKKEGLLPLEVGYVQGSKPTGERAILVELWATWCGPCRQTIPHLNALYEQYHLRGLDVVGISNEDTEPVRAFMRQVPIRYAVGLDPAQRYQKALKVRAIPHAFLLDRDGKLVWEGHPLSLAPNQIESVLPPPPR